MHRKPCLVILCCMVAAALTVSSWTPSVPCPDHALATSTQVDGGVAEGVGPTPHRTVGYTEPQVGDQFSYQFVLRQSSEVGGSGESLAPESVAATIRGSFSDTLCAVTEEGHVYEVAVTHLVVEQGGATVPLAVQGKALRVLKGPDGLVVGYGTGVDEHARLPRMLFLRVHQVPVQGSGRITAEDETGRCDFEYDSAAADNGRRIVTRKKERIVPIRASEVPTSIEIRASNDRVEQEDGRTMKAVCHEVLAIDAGGIPVVAVLDLEAECVARTRVDVEPGVPSQFTTWPRLAPAEEARTPPTLDEALVELRGLEAKDELGSIAMHRVFAGLVERLASDPSAVDDLVQRLLGGEVAPPHLSLDLAGLLVSALADAAAAGGTRAVESVGQLVQRLPSGELLGALGRALHQLGGLPPEVVGPVLAVTTERLRFLPLEEDPAGDLTIALGGLMRTVGAGTEEARHALAVLRERAAGNGNPGRLVTALAESRDVELIRTEVLPLASHGDGGVRLRVMEALAVCANDPESRRALLRAAEGDSDADVRIAAAGSLASSGTADARRILIRMATSDPDVSVRVAALHLLARGRDAEVLAVLGRAASQDPDSEVRRIAAELARGS